MTQSKSSLALLPVALFAGLVFRAAWRGKRDRVIVMAVLGLVAVGAIVFAIVDQSAIVRLFEDPTEFTGRAEIWQAQLAYIRDHLYLGAGFGSFSDTGDLSPLHNYVESNWINDVAHGHNAYLQLFVTIGGVGFLLAVAALILSPLIAFCRAHADEAAQMAPLFAIFVFMALHNFVESDFLEGDGPAWVVFLLMLAALRVARDADAHEADEGLQPWPVP
jgi:O-antigen ligase